MCLLWEKKNVRDFLANLIETIARFTNGVLVSEGGPQTLELSCGGQAPCSTGFPYQVSVPGTHLYQCTRRRCCERLCLASVIFFFFFKTQPVCPFHDGWFMSTCPHRSWVFSSFDQKNPAWPPCPSLPIHLILPQATFCFFGWKKSSEGNISPIWKRWNKKLLAKTLKRHRNWRVQKLFWAVKKSLNRYIASNGEYFEGDCNLNM